MEQPQQLDQGSSGLHRSCLILGKCTRAATEEFAGFRLRETEIPSNAADFVWSEFRSTF